MRVGRMIVNRAERDNYILIYIDCFAQPDESNELVFEKMGYKQMNTFILIFYC